MRGGPPRDTGTAGLPAPVDDDLRLSEQRFRRAFEDAPSGMALVALDGHFLRINRAYCELLGYSEEEMLARDFQSITHPEDLETDLQHVQELLAGERRSYAMEKRYIRRDGSIVNVLLHGSLIIDDDAKPLHFIAQVLDITERKRMEGELHKAKEAAEAANRAKGEFLANMSHEIRTPMNGVLGMTELVLGTELTRDQRDCLEMSHDSARALLRVIDDILDFSKIEAGKLTLESVEFDLRELLHATASLFILSAQAKGVSLSATIDSAVPERVSGDPVRLRQVLANLVGNAVKFTAAGSVELLVDVVADAREGGLFLRFVVRDTGIGIGREKQKYIFDAFEQADPSMCRRFGGTGLGLTISDRLVRLMGGRLSVESKPGRGSTFAFVARLSRAEATGAAPASAAMAEAIDAAPAIPLRVLLAEDNPVNQKLVMRLLDRRGHEVVVVGNGHDAVAAVQRQDFDVVLMDVQMPEMDGMAAAAAIRMVEAARGGHVPIVALTAHAMKGDAERCLSAGMDAYVTKPIESRQLFDVIDTLTAANRQRRVA